MMLETVGKVSALEDYNVGVLSDTKAFIDTLSRDTSFEAYSQCGELCVSVSDPNNDKFKVHSWNLLSYSGVYMVILKAPNGQNNHKIYLGMSNHFFHRLVKGHLDKRHRDTRRCKLYDLWQIAESIEIRLIAIMPESWRTNVDHVECWLRILEQTLVSQLMIWRPEEFLRLQPDIQFGPGWPGDCFRSQEDMEALNSQRSFEGLARSIPVLELNFFLHEFRYQPDSSGWPELKSGTILNVRSSKQRENGGSGDVLARSWINFSSLQCEFTWVKELQLPCSPELAAKLHLHRIRSVNVRAIYGGFEAHPNAYMNISTLNRENPDHVLASTFALKITFKAVSGESSSAPVDCVYWLSVDNFRHATQWGANPAGQVAFVLSTIDLIENKPITPAGPDIVDIIGAGNTDCAKNWVTPAIDLRKKLISIISKNVDAASNTFTCPAPGCSFKLQNTLLHCVLEMRHMLSDQGKCSIASVQGYGDMTREELLSILQVCEHCDQGFISSSQRFNHWEARSFATCRQKEIGRRLVTEEPELPQPKFNCTAHGETYPNLSMFMKHGLAHIECLQEEVECRDQRGVPPLKLTPTTNLIYYCHIAECHDAWGKIPHFSHCWRNLAIHYETRHVGQPLPELNVLQQIPGHYDQFLPEFLNQEELEHFAD
ncbi:hypothetical protein BKA65DRAFT_553492 [Rhexocercosporidium sp. MPI-PUGE-AT-0058]|nr:hypothetical protein BKA65DRAFT_553492 [Rhexocercosporidium sp. MPI-PUGE-AT-0058]